VGKLLGRHEISTIGATTSVAAGIATANVDLALVATGGSFPFTVLVRATVDAYLRQGTSVVEAAITDFVLKKGSYYKLTIFDNNSRYLAAMRVDSTSGTVYITRNDSLTPGDTT